MANTTMHNGTQYHLWKTEPLVRGTFSILSSSLLTMILCVWTAVHLNIPEYKGANKQLWRKTAWMITALFAPEWFKVVFTAYCEHLAANDIGKTMRKAFGQPEPPDLVERLEILNPRKLLRQVERSWKRLSHGIYAGFSELGYKTDTISLATYNRQVPEQSVQHTDTAPVRKSQRYPWTHSHSLYATMGGFAVDTRGLDLAYLPSRRQRMTLTLAGLTYISEYHPRLVPDIPESEIQDKSKANMFTKVLTCGQALWFGIQCLTRLSQGLSISLLEINTAVHAACALALYWFLWWSKPLDVEEPTILTHDDTHSVVAFLAVCDMFSGAHFSPMDMQDNEDLESASEPGDIIAHHYVKNIRLRPSKDPRFPRQDYLVYHGFAVPTARTISTPGVQNLTETDFQRFRVASEAARKYDLRTPENVRKDNLEIRLRNRPMIASSSTGSEWNSSLVGFPLAGLFYGTVHLLVWNRPFRGETDELLWKLSSLTILLSGIPLAVSAGSFILYVEFLDENPKVPTSVRVTYVVTFSLFILCFTLLYAFCRAFIIVECFLDVFHLPESAFEVPRWSQYFPHIG